MSVIKIQMGERVRECQEADFDYFKARGYSKVEKKATRKKVVKAEVDAESVTVHSED